MGLSAPPPARAAAHALLVTVLRRHRPLDEALEASGALAALDERDRGFVRLLVGTVMRRLGQIDALIAHCLERPLPHKAATAQDVLRLGVAQLVFVDTPAHAAVDTTVELARSLRADAHVKLVNAVMRRLDREGRALAAAQDAPLLNTPGWLWRAWVGAYGENTARAIAAAHLREAPLDITVRGEAQAWAERLDARLLPTGSLRREAGGNVALLPGFDEGAWWVQDAAAALPARLLGPVAGLNVADLCAAPGGKTAQLAAAGARVVAIDRAPRRLQRLEENLRRLALSAETVAADAAEWRPAAPLDAVLLDAPCTATGTLRRHPDVARLKTPEDVARLSRIQYRLLRNAVQMLKPGGRLVYCVCSLQPEEGSDQIEALLAEGAPLRRVPIDPAELGVRGAVTPEGELRTLPHLLAEAGGMDAFYGARLERL